MENKKLTMEAYIPPPNRSRVLEPDLAYVNTTPSTSGPRVHAVPVNQPNLSPSRTLKCWNCQREGHRHNACPQPRKRLCFKCGKPNETVRTCPRCSGNATGAR